MTYPLHNRVHSLPKNSTSERWGIGSAGRNDFLLLEKFVVHESLLSAHVSLSGG